MKDEWTAVPTAVPDEERSGLDHAGYWCMKYTNEPVEVFTDFIGCVVILSLRNGKLRESYWGALGHKLTPLEVLAYAALVP